MIIKQSNHKTKVSNTEGEIRKSVDHLPDLMVDKFTTAITQSQTRGKSAR